MKGEEEEPKKLSNGYLLIKEEEMKKKQVVRYKECRKNHAANIGGYAVDGCCEFMAAGEEGTISALRCAACGCHRNFHRREVENVFLCQCYSCDRSSSIR